MEFTSNPEFAIYTMVQDASSDVIKSKERAVSIMTIRLKVQDPAEEVKFGFLVNCKAHVEKTVIKLVVPIFINLGVIPLKKKQ
jgi:hypothetical protein